MGLDPRSLSRFSSGLIYSYICHGSCHRPFAVSEFLKVGKRKREEGLCLNGTPIPTLRDILRIVKQVMGVACLSSSVKTSDPVVYSRETYTSHS